MSEIETSEVPLTEEYLKNSILTSYPQSCLDLFKERRPEDWERVFGKPKPELRIVKDATKEGEG